MFRDKDYLRTNDGLMFNVIGYEHPADRVTANLKYVNQTKWTSGYSSSVAFLKRHYPCYIDDIVSVPRSKVAQAYLPREGLSRIRAATDRNELEQTAVDVVCECSEYLRVPPDRFGITDSLLWGRGGCDSDIDLVVYGQAAASAVLDRMRLLFDQPGFKRLTAENFTRQATPHSAQLEELCRRKFNKGVYRGVRFSLRAVRDHDGMDVSIPYVTYGTIEFTGRIVDDSESLFFPATYVMDCGVKVVSYLMQYEAVFAKGEVVTVRGTLERGSEDRVVVGSLCGDGHGIAVLGADASNAPSL